MRIGIIIEANPYHYGHRHFIQEIRKQIQETDEIIALVTTSFSMRGTISLLSKKDKTKILLSEGVDEIWEYPTILATQSCDYFAKNALSILSSLQITHLAFGVETPNIDFLNDVSMLLDNTSIQETFRKSTLKHKSYEQKFIEALKQHGFKEELITNCLKPNNLLGIHYLRQIRLQKAQIKPIIIERNNDYKELQLNNNPITSANSIRQAILNKEDVQNYLPYSIEYLCDLNNSLTNYYIILKQSLCMNPLDLNKFFMVNNGVDKFLIKTIIQTSNYQEFINLLSTKNMTRSRLLRTILYIMIHYLKEDAKAIYPSYYRLLGISDKGIEFLKELNPEIKKQIFSSPKANNLTMNTKQILHYELLTTRLYDIITNQMNYQVEYKFPLRKGKENE